MGGWGGEVEGMPGTLGTAEKSGEAIEWKLQWKLEKLRDAA